MSIKTVSVYCPQCGASLEWNGDTPPSFCTYCGAKIQIQNDNEYIVRHVDEAKLLEEQNRMKRLQMEEDERKRQLEQEKEKNKMKIIAVATWIAAMAIIALVNISISGKNDSYVGWVVLAVIFFAGKKIISGIFGKKQSGSQSEVVYRERRTANPVVEIIRILVIGFIVLCIVLSIYTTIHDNL